MGDTSVGVVIQIHWFFKIALLRARISSIRWLASHTVLDVVLSRYLGEVEECCALGERRCYLLIIRDHLWLWSASISRFHFHIIFNLL